MDLQLLDKEFSIGNFGDRRLNKTGALLFERLINEPSARIKELAHNRAEQVRFQRFLWNQSVTSNEILKTTYEKTALLSSKCEHVLAIQDTTEINLDHRRNKIKGLGLVSNDADIGIFAHPVLAMDPKDNFILGLASFKLWSRDPHRKRHYEIGNRQKINIKEKESYRWIETAIETKKTLKNSSKITFISDRESDLYAFYYIIPDNKTNFIIRSRTKRFVLSKSENKKIELSKFCLAQAVKDQKEITVPRQSKKRSKRHPNGKDLIKINSKRILERNALISLRYKKITILRPECYFDLNAPKNIELTVIDVCEDNPPEDCKKIHWRLLTSHQVKTVEDAWQIVSWYKKRWFIESLFKTAKSAGMRIEEIELTKSESIKKFSILMIISAVKILQLTLSRELHASRKADLVFNKDEINLMEILEPNLSGKTTKQKNPYPKNTIAWCYWIIGRLGGWMGYASEGPAGSQIISRGLYKFNFILNGFLLKKNMCIG